MGSGNSYKKLVSTTMILAIGSFSSKVLVFFLMPFYTRVLSPTEYGTVNLIVQASNLLIPLASAGIINSVIRFGLEKDSNKSAVFTTGIFTVLGGFAILCCFGPLLNLLDAINGYTVLVLVYVLMSALHSVCAQFVQAKKYTKLYALDGVLRTIMTIGLNILFLVTFDMGITGYVLATVVSDFLSTIFLWFIASLGRYFHISSMNRHTTATMLKYSIPLIPTMVCTWVISMSDQFMIEYFIDEAATGIYSVSNKVPHILSIAASIFGDAWQISIVSEDREKQRKFFSDVFATYQCIALLGASGLIMCAKIIVMVLASKPYYTAWEYIPFLVLGTMFSCLGTFLGSIYMVEKQSIYTLLTMAAGAVTNVVLNLIFIPIIGVMGAAAATMVSYFLMFLLRGIHTRLFIPVRWHLPKFLLSALLVCCQAALILAGAPFWPLWEILLFLGVLALNCKELLRSLFRLF